MAVTVHTLPSRSAWLAARRIGGSDVATVLGVSPWDRTTEWDLYERLALRLIRDDPPTAAMERGTRLEPRVIDSYQQATGTRLRRPKPNTLWTREPWASASIDAGVPGELVVEAKTARNRNGWGEPTVIERWTPEAAQVVRAHYALQVYHNMRVLGVEVGDLAVLLPPEDDPFDPPELRVYRLLRDPELEERLVDRLAAWWDERVVRRVPPPWDGSAAADRVLDTLPRGLGRREARTIESLVATYYDYAARMSRYWEAERKKAGQMLVGYAQGYDGLDLPGGGKVTIAYATSGGEVDMQRLAEERPDVVEVLGWYETPTRTTRYPRVTLGNGG